MSIVNAQIPITSAGNSQYIREILEQYPFARRELLTTTAYGRPVETLILGTGPRKVFYSASHHANEWITSLVLLKFMEEFAQALASGGAIGGMDAAALGELVTIYALPLVNPDGVDLVTGAIGPGNPGYDNAKLLGSNYPDIPFPEGWKANLLGVDLNLNYPAGWFLAQEIKAQQGYTLPGPRDFVGRSPLDQAETRAIAKFTEFLQPDLILAYHTQGQVIYWKYLDIAVPGAEALGKKLSEVSGYTLENTPYQSGFAGYKDWFIQSFRRPGYTIEVGLGKNPLPLSQFDRIYQDNLGILVTSAASGA